VVEALWNRISDEEFERLSMLICQRKALVQCIKADLESEPPFSCVKPAGGGYRMSLSQWRYLLVRELELTKARTLENWSGANLDMRAGIVGGVRGIFMG